jgi:flagellar M-ring protein FliF
VVVNNKKVAPAKPGGVATSAPLSADELTQINALVKEAIGFSKDRGDSINVVNAAFTPPTVEVLPEVPLWKQADNIDTAKEVGRYLLVVAIALFVVFKVLKPLMRQVTTYGEAKARDEEDQAALDSDGQPTNALAVPQLSHSLEKARAIAKDDPRIVANVIRDWVSRDE